MMIKVTTYFPVYGQPDTMYESGLDLAEVAYWVHEKGDTTVTLRSGHCVCILDPERKVQALLEQQPSVDYYQELVAFMKNELRKSRYRFAVPEQFAEEFTP